MTNINLPNPTPDWIVDGENVDANVTNRPIVDVHENVLKIKDFSEKISDNFNVLVGEASSWNSDTQYYTNSIVSHNGKLWISLIDNNNEEPGEGNNWKIFDGFNFDTSGLRRYDKKLDLRNIIEIKYDNDDDISLIRYEGDNNDDVYYRSVMKYDSNKKLIEVKYYYNNDSNGTDDWNGRLKLTYDSNDNLIATTYEEQ